MVARFKKWCFTLNNYTNDHVLFLTGLFPDKCKYLVFGKEIGASGTPHLQGFIWLITEASLVQALALLGCPGIHIEVAKGSPQQASAYCKKDGDVTEVGELKSGSGKRNDWHDLRDWLKSLPLPPSDLELLEQCPHLMARHRASIHWMIQKLCPHPRLQTGDLRVWQSALERQLLEAPDDRTVLFVVDPSGNTGKTWFQKFMITKYPNEVQLLLTGKRDDMTYAVDTDRVIFMINVPRSSMEFLQYSVLEMLKDGIVHSPKYESRTKFIKPCHVVVFCNENPDLNKMSADRYVFITPV
jgi:Putative viral replication protein